MSIIDQLSVTVSNSAKLSQVANEAAVNSWTLHAVWVSIVAYRHL